MFRALALVLLASFLPLHPVAAANACVWKVSNSTGGTVYLGGSVHSLRGTDYPIPAAFTQALDASKRVVFETDLKAQRDMPDAVDKIGKYPRGDNLKNHVDPRTYDYLRRIFTRLNIPEERFAPYRPWYLSLILQSGSKRGSADLGVENYLLKRAQAGSKPVAGLESLREHIEVFSGLTERQAEALLLITFIIPDDAASFGGRIIQAWRRGDADTLAAMMKQSFSDFPTMGERLLAMRNHKWVPKIEGYMRSGQTHFVVAGAAHFGGSDGVIALLKARGYKIEQL